MKVRNIFSILALIALFTASCDDATENLGKEIRPAGDEIIVKSDTFHLASETLLVKNIISRPDSFLVGEFQDQTLGVAKGQVLAEVKLFEDGFQFIDEQVATTQVDSVTMSFSISSYFGKDKTPLHLSVYEMKDSLQRKAQYLSDMDPEPFVDKSKLIGEALFPMRNPATGAIRTQFTFRMKDDFATRFFTTNPLHYKNQEEFRKFFKGIFITTDFGGVTMLNMKNVRITLHYNYVYKANPTQKLYGSKDFFVGPEVRKVNIIRHPIQQQVFESLNLNEEFNHIASPANYYTRIRIPLDRLRRDIQIDGKIVTVNSALLKIYVQKKQTSDMTMIPYVNNLLLIKEDSLDVFFAKRKMLSDSYAFLASRDSVYVSPQNYNYEFNFTGLARLVESEVKKKTDNNAPLPEYLNMVLVPVTPIVRQSSSSVVVSEVVQSNLMQSLSIYSGKNKSIPMKMEVIYSGF